MKKESYRRLSILILVVGFAFTPILAELISASFDYWLQGQATGISAAGFNKLALPYDREGMDSASALLDDIEDDGGTGSVNSISRYLRTTGGLKTYAGIAIANDFDLHCSNVLFTY